MKVLWLSPKGLSLEKSDYVGSNWISSLEEFFMKQNVDLSIAFSSTNNIYSKHVINNRNYYELPVYNKNNKINRYGRRIFNILEDQKIALFNIHKVIDDFKPDIIQIWGSENVLGVATKIDFVPHVLHFQGNLSVYFHKLFSGFSKAHLYKIASTTDRLKRAPNIYIDQRFKKESNREKQYFSNCKNIFGRTQWDRRVSAILAPQANYFHCDEVLRDEFYQQRWSNPNNTSFVLCSIMRDNLYKGLETVYETAKLLKSHKINFTWNVIGIKNNDVTPRLVKMSKNIELESVPVNLVGKKKSSEIVDYLLNSNLLVHPSHIDNSPNSICEGMLLGIPVLATTVGGIPTLFKNYQTGYLVQDGDPWSTAGTILEIMQDYSTAMEFGQNARKIALKRHNKEEIFNTVMKAYKNIIQAS